MELLSQEPAINDQIKLKAYMSKIQIPKGTMSWKVNQDIIPCFKVYEYLIINCYLVNKFIYNTNILYIIIYCVSV